jgi:UDP-glucose 4-epimerase
MRTVVTGGAGFIGSNLVDALVERGDEVVVIDNFATGRRDYVNPEATLLEHDIREPFTVDAEVVFHLAAQADVQTSMQRPAYDAAVNVVGTVNVLLAAADAQVIFSSSGGAGYGECPVPAGENAPFEPMSPYGIAKKCGEEYLLGWNRIHGTTHVPLRFANVYGPRQDSGLEGGVVAIFLERLALGEPTTIFGDGAQSRDFVYVDDVVEAMLATVGRSGGPYNIGTGQLRGVRRPPARRAGAAGRRPPVGARRVAQRTGARLAPPRLAGRRPAPHVGLDAGPGPGVAKRGVPWTPRSKHTRHWSGRGERRRSSRASSRPSSSSSCSGPCSCSSRNRSRTRCSGTRPQPHSPR